MACEPHTGAAYLLPWAAWLAEALRTCLDAVGCALQLLKQHEGARMGQALQRTVYRPANLLAFWCNSVVTLVAVDKTSGEPCMIKLAER